MKRREHRDWTQVYEKELSEEREQHARTERLKRTATKYASRYWGEKQAAQKNAAACRALAAESKRQVTLAEQDTRRVTFQNLSLHRQLSLLSDVVPRVEHEVMRARLESIVAEQAEHIIALRAQLAQHDAENDVDGEGPEI